MKDNLAIVAEFADKIKTLGNKHILQIVLFGSVARGEDTRDSDIDIAIIHDLEKTDELEKNIHKFQHSKIQTVFIYVNKLTEETELVSALTGEGILLYGNPLNVKLKEKSLRPMVLISYDTTNIDPKERMKLNRALHGGISKSSYKKKKYITKTSGILNQPGFEKIGKAVILAEPKKANKLEAVLKRFGAESRVRSVWI